MTEIKPLARSTDIVIQEMGDEILIYDLQTDQAFSLNSTSSAVWQYCDGNRTVSSIAELMTLDAKEKVSEDLVWLTLDGLKKQNLIENQPELSNHLSQVSRRELIQRAGAASILALPFVSSLVAPLSVNAASLTCPGAGVAGNNVGCPCSANGNCTSGCCGATGLGAANQFCVATGSDGIGSFCRAGCECSTGCCPTATNICSSNAGAVGSACTTACQCAQPCCVGGLCSNDTVASGGACVLACQCIGASTCSGGTCT